MRAQLVFSALLVGLALSDSAGDPPKECVNGAPNKADPTMCDCQPYWTPNDEDDGKCNIMECVNGGYIDGDYCHCPRGYYGIHCDAVKLARPVEGVFHAKKSFNLYIHKEFTDWYGMTAIKRIKDQIPKLLPAYNDSFISYNFLQSSSGETSTVTPFSGKDGQTNFLAALQGLKPEDFRTHSYTCNPSSISYNAILENLKKEKIEDSVLLMFTQYPPGNPYKDENKVTCCDDKNAADLANLKEYLRAFRVKINLLIGADEILLDCNKKKGSFDELIDLVHFTDGEAATYLVEDDTTSVEQLLPSFIFASASPQSHSRAASFDSCKGLALNFQTDPYPNTYYIAVRTDQKDAAVITGSCSSGGVVTDVAVSEYEEFTLSSILSGAQQTCTLTVTSTGGCLATVYSVGGKKDVDRFEIFHSFATSPDMDSDSIHSFSGEDVYLTMHIDVSSDGNELPKYLITAFNGSAIVKNEKEQDESLFDLEKRDRSTFEYQSDQKLLCPKDGISWIQLTLNGFNINGEIVSVLNRIIHLNCEDRTAPVDPPLPKLFLMDAEETTPRPATTLALMFSNSLPTSQFSRFILEGVDDKVNHIEEKFYNYGFLRFNCEEPKPMTFNPITEFPDFKKAVYDNAPDSSLNPQDNLVDRLQKLTAEGKLKPDSLVSIAIDKPMSQSRADPTNTAQLSNIGSRLLFWGDVDTVKIVQFTDKLKLYTRLAAVSAGHFILMDMDDFPDNDDNGDFYVSFALRDLYSSGPSQRLLSYSNLEWDRPESQTSTSNPIGSLQIPEGTSEVFVSITLNVEDPQDVGNAFMLSLVLEGATDRIVLDLSKLKQYGTPGFTRSNLYTANFTVVGGETYDGTFTLLAITPYTGAHIRFWTARDIEDPIPDLTYEDFSKTTIQPDDYYGAALRVPDDTGKTMALRFYDRIGNEALRNDHNQTVDVTDGKAHFVPYFCNSEQSKSDFTKDMYTIEITYDTGFKYFRPMLCTKSKEDPICKEVRDDNTYCTESNPPFHRGPSEKLVDCSDVGQVKYSEDSDAVNNYKCFCDTGFYGQSCEQSICEEGIVHLPEEDDVKFRTLSYVLLSPAGDDACGSLIMYYADEARQLFKENAVYTDIWQYTFSVYFTDGTARTLYRGPSFADFYAQFDILDINSDTFNPDALNTETFCGNSKNKRDLDLNDVFNVAVESVGRNSRGIVLLYAIQTFADEPDKTNELYKAYAPDELYQSIQAYQQHIYMVTPNMIPDFISMTAASGGVAVRMSDDYNLYTTAMTTYRKTFDTILNSQIGWAGVFTDDVSMEVVTKKPEEPRDANGPEVTTETKTWTIRQDSELFVTIRTSKNGVSPVVTVTGNPTKTILSEDGGYAASQHASILAGESTPVTVDVTFDNSTTDYDLVQIVILTKGDPIRNALIGQSQPNTDKHAAGATNSSEKAVHISFNKDAEKFIFSPLDKNWRQAARINCSFAQEFVAFVQPFESVGVSVVDFSVSPPKNGKLDESKSFSLAVPLAVSEIIDCVNGDFDAMGSFCACDPGWSGPTCSQPSCGEGGTLNSHGDHCDCTGAEYGGLFCTDGKESSFFE